MFEEQLSELFGLINTSAPTGDLKMKQFDPTKKVQTRDGRKVRIVCTDVKSRWQIIALITNNNGRETISAYDSSGRARGREENGDDHILDLINVPVRTSTWFNLYEPDLICGSYPSHDVCNLRQTSNRLAVLEIIYEDGKPINVKLHKDKR